MPSLTISDGHLHELELSVLRSDSVRRSAGTLYTVENHNLAVITTTLMYFSIVTNVTKGYPSTSMRY
jgi:hypothetical protein